MSKRSLIDIARWIALLAVLVVLLFPLFWIISSSLKARGEFFTRPPVWMPAHPEWLNYPDSLRRGGMKGLTDSFTIAFFSMAVSLLLGTPAAYAIARFQVGKKNLAFWILSIRMFPPIATILPLFVIFRFVGLVDSYVGLVLCYTVFNLPFAIWILKGFIEDLPREIEEAAKVDGATRFQIFRNIVIPLDRSRFGGCGTVHLHLRLERFRLCRHFQRIECHAVAGRDCPVCRWPRDSLGPNLRRRHHGDFTSLSPGDFLAEIPDPRPNHGSGEMKKEGPTPGGRASPRAADPVCIVDPIRRLIGSMLGFANNGIARTR